MLYKTGGIALSYIKFKETSIIARVFTEAFGMQSYIVNGIRSKNAKTRIALFQPLTLLDLVVYHNKKKDINRISEIKCTYNFHSIPFNIKKTSIALFLTELLNHALIDEGENEALFEFIHESIRYLDAIEKDYENFHLQFMMRLSKYLGIYPQTAVGLLKEIGHSKIHSTEFSDQLDFLLQSKFDEHIRLSKSTRNELLKAILDYYRFHYDSIKEIKSIQVLKEVLT
jgi:DNA repair protein RecO (recombination protein O)